jgi:hypothetical protein
MSSNLAESFGPRSRPSKVAAAAEKTPPPSKPRRRPPGEKDLHAAGIWLPISLYDRLKAHCRAVGITQAETILRAVEHAADHLDQLEDRPPPEKPIEYTGGLFPRPKPAAEQDSGPASRAISVRFRSEHFQTLTRLAIQHNIKRSVLIRVSLTDYLDTIEQQT